MNGMFLIVILTSKNETCFFVVKLSGIERSLNFVIWTKNMYLFNDFYISLV